MWELMQFLLQVFLDTKFNIFGQRVDKIVIVFHFGPVNKHWLDYYLLWMLKYSFLSEHIGFQTLDVFANLGTSLFE